MTYDRKMVADEAERFVNSRDPVALLSFPGCGPFGISPSYLDAPDLRFEGDERLVIHDPAEFVALVTWIATGEEPVRFPRFETFRKALRVTICYCEKVLSIIALRPRECVHEAHYKRFLDYGDALASVAGWEFNLAQPESANGRRIYRVVRTHSRLVGSNLREAFLPVTGLLAIRFVSSKCLYLVIDGTPESGQLTAHVELRDRLTGVLRLFELVEKVPDRGLNAYRILGEYLRKTFDEPVRTEEILNEAAAQIGEEAGPNYPVREIISSLLDGSPGPGLIQFRIEAVLRRLWDAPLVANKVRDLIDPFFASSDFIARFGGLSLSARADIAALTMPLEKLEAEDLYLWREDRVPVGELVA